MLMRFNRAELESLRAGLDVLRTVLPLDDERRLNAEALLDHMDRAPHRHSIVIRRTKEDVEILSDSEDLSDLTIVVQGDQTTLHKPVIDHATATKIVAETLRLRDRRRLLGALKIILDLSLRVKPNEDSPERLRRILQQILETATHAEADTEDRSSADVDHRTPRENWEAGAPYLLAEGD